MIVMVLLLSTFETKVSGSWPRGTRTSETLGEPVSDLRWRQSALNRESPGFSRGECQVNIRSTRFLQMTWIQIGKLRFRISFMLLMIWGLFILYGTTIPFDFSAPSAQVAAKLHQVLERPWQAASRMDIVSNVLLFLPWGFLCAVWLAGHGVGYVAAIVVASLSGLAISGFVETLQLFAPMRSTSLIDLVTNFSGSLGGSIIGWPLARWVSPLALPRLKRMLGERPMLSLALLAAGGLVLFDLAPFDVSIDIGDLKTAIKAARPIPFGPAVDGSELAAEPWSWASETLTWMLVSGVFLLAFRECGRTGAQAIIASAAVAAVLSLAIEVLQLTIRSRSTDATSVFWSFLGALVGAAVVGRSSGAQPRRWLDPAIAVWLLIGMIESWTPLNLVWPDQKVLSPERLVPFLAYYRRTDIHALADLISQVLFFVPLGALLARRFPRISIGRGTVIGFCLGLLLELGQLFLRDRTCEITDALSAGFGAGLGLYLWRWGQTLHDPSRRVARYRVGPVNHTA